MCIASTNINIVINKNLYTFFCGSIIINKQTKTYTTELRCPLVKYWCNIYHQNKLVLVILIIQNEQKS